jgi:hypothetical protein
MPKPLRRRCDARLPVRETARDRAIRAGELAKYLRRNRCKNWAVRGSKRCRLHGGLSTGPTTVEGKARTIEAMSEEARRRMEEHARRKARADAGLPYWTEEEWENL